MLIILRKNDLLVPRKEWSISEWHPHKACSRHDDLPSSAQLLPQACQRIYLSNFSWIQPVPGAILDAHTPFRYEPAKQQAQLYLRQRLIRGGSGEAQT